MKGQYRIVIQNKRIRYDFTVRRNLTIIRGDSATGKTALVDMVREYSENGAASGIALSCQKDCAVLEGKNWALQLSGLRESIVFIEEGNSFVSSADFAAGIQKTDNYYIIVSRESLPALPYSVEEIYGIHSSGKYGILKQTYNEFYHIYGKRDYTKMILPELVLTEDSNSGYQFFGEVCAECHLTCKTAEGKSNIFACLSEDSTRDTLVVADGAAFGPEMEKIMRLLAARENITLYLPESFEWLLLKSNILQDKEVSDILEETCEYVASEEYFSWERYFTALLTRKTVGTYLQYSKKTLNPVYTQRNEKVKILSAMEAAGRFFLEKEAENREKKQEVQRAENAQL